MCACNVLLVAHPCHRTSPFCRCKLLCSKTFLLRLSMPKCTLPMGHRCTTWKIPTRPMQKSNRQRRNNRSRRACRRCSRHTRRQRHPASSGLATISMLQTTRLQGKAAPRTQLWHKQHQATHHQTPPNRRNTRDVAARAASCRLCCMTRRLWGSSMVGFRGVGGGPEKGCHVPTRKTARKRKARNSQIMPTAVCVCACVSCLLRWSQPGDAAQAAALLPRGWKMGWPSRACVPRLPTPPKRTKNNRRNCRMLRRMLHRCRQPTPRRAWLLTEQPHRKAPAAEYLCCNDASNPRHPHARGSYRVCRCRAPRKPLGTPTLPRYTACSNTHHVCVAQQAAKYGPKKNTGQ